MRAEHWTNDLIRRVALSNDGNWVSANGLLASDCLREFTGDHDAQADFCGLLIDEIKRLQHALDLEIHAHKLTADMLQEKTLMVTELERDNATYFAERQRIRELAGHSVHEFGPDLVTCVANKLAELKAALQKYADYSRWNLHSHDLDPRRHPHDWWQGEYPGDDTDGWRVALEALAEKAGGGDE